jgi:hypothetical protein
MSFNSLRSQIKTVLESISDLQEVSGTPKLKFDGYPAAVVVPSAHENAYETTSENIRTYAFDVQIFYETKDTGVGEAIDRLENVVDTVLDKMDKEDQSATRTIGATLPTGYTFLNIMAVPGAIGEIPGEELAVATLTIRVRISVDIT